MLRILLSVLLCCLLSFADSSTAINVAQAAYGSAGAIRHAQVQRQYFGQVVHVSDGDTLILQTRLGEKIKVRLYGIDAPEKAQPYGPQSAGILKQMVSYKYVQVHEYNKDRYGRSVGKVYLDRQDINAEMIKLGAAWHYRYYDKTSDYDRYEGLEHYARGNRFGLWNRSNPMPPWDYRRMVREQKKK